MLILIKTYVSYKSHVSCIIMLNFGFKKYVGANILDFDSLL